MPSSAAPEQGQLVQVRARPWVVTDVVQGGMPLDALALSDPEHLVTLRPIDDGAEPDESLRVIWEAEPGARVIERGGLPSPTEFDDPQRFDAFLDAVRWAMTSQADRRQLLAPFQSGIEIEAYQLEPLARAIAMPRTSLLIADDVGLGKTIEAGLVAQELLLRYRARRMLVLCPADLQQQWRDELREKFGLEFWIIDTAFVRELRRSRGIGVNPWTVFPRVIASYDWLKRERPLRSFRETLPAGDEPRYPRRWDLLIVDEAHNVAPSGRGKYATDSQRTKLVREIVPHFEHRLFLTATPHNGYAESCSALLELLDDQRFARTVEPDRAQLGPVLVRRMKEQFRDFDGASKFARRVVAPIEVTLGNSEREAHGLLQRYIELRLAGAADPRERTATEFVTLLLKKRLLSSPRAFANTLATHRETVEHGRAAKPAPEVVLRNQIAHLDEAFDDDEAFESAQADAHEEAIRCFRPLSGEERALLDRLRACAEAASVKADARARALITYLEGLPDDERVIVYTEYRDTQRWLADLLRSRPIGRGDRLELIWGGMEDDRRAEIKAAFQAPPSQAPVRILLATDAASEGINLQHHCHRLVHYEIPWNPNRMEQRNGRVDRHGQSAPEVLIHHFAPAASTSGDALDAELLFLRRCVEKVEAIRAALGSVGPVIAQQVSEAMLGRRSELDTVRAEAATAKTTALLASERRIADEVRELREQFDETRVARRLTPAHVERAVATALELAGQPRLVAGSAPGRFRLPALTGSWARAGEGLAHPHSGVQRELTFEPALADRDEAVLCHLGHRLVQMSLRLLRARAFAAPKPGELERVTARQSDDAQLHEPAVLVHGRLVVTGADGHRLHEELVSAGGYLRDGRFVRENGVGVIERLVASGLEAEAPSDIAERLRALHPRIEEQLLRALEARGKERTESLDRRLDQQRDHESRAISTVLGELRERILRELGVDHQATLFAPDERDQFERNRDALARRVDEIPAEIEREQAALARRFAQAEPRLLPVAVEYLVPRSRP